MGEYAEMMLNGTCCEACGEYLGDGDGFPAYCSAACAEDRGVTPSMPKDRKQRAAVITCPHCGKKFIIAMSRDNHIRDKRKGGCLVHAKRAVLS